jgi:DNA-binding CsgD family transcriptional regulator
MAALKLGWLTAFILMNTSLPADIVSKQLARLLLKTGGIIFLAYLGVMTAAWFMRNDGLLQASSTFLETLIIGGALIASFHLLFSTKGLPKGARRKSVLIFAGYHLGLLGIILAVLVTGWLQPGPQRLAQLLANGGFLVLFNIFPLVWIKWFQPLQPISGLERFEVLGITKREREIIKLIQAGKTNQEIADDLFISVATVKDHNHNLFRKSGVRNRLELANLFR